MGKLLIESQTLKDLKEHPEKFTKETIELYNKAVNEAEQSDEYTITSVDLAIKQDSDYSVYMKSRIKNGELIFEECIPYEEYIKEHFACDAISFSTNDSYTTKGGVI